MLAACEETIEVTEADFDLMLQFANQFTECYLTLKPKTNPLSLTPDILEGILRDHHISVGVQPEVLRTICQEAQTGNPVTDFLIARGSLPEPGHDAFLEFAIKPFSLAPDFDENTRGQIDFHQAHLFDNVKAGQIIGTGHAAVPSRNGQTVTGKIIPTPLLHIHPTRLGSGVEFQPETSQYVAKISGRVIYKERTLSVTEEFFVEKDVDYHTGNIQFVGFVHVLGDVLDGFNVRGQKGIKISGSAGNCTLESDGDIELGCMNGRDHQARIRCGGDLKVGCLFNADVECAGNVYIRKEASHTFIKSKGAVYITGRIVGGICVALAGIEAAVVGSDVGVKTLLRAGIDFQLIQTVDAFWDRLKGVETKLLALSRLMEKLQSLPGELNPSRENQKQKASLEAEIHKVGVQKEELLEKINWIQAHTAGLAHAKINITKELNSSTVIRLGRTEQEIKQTLSGAHSIIEKDGTELIISGLTPLTQRAL